MTAERIVWRIGLVGGLLLVFLVPPFQGPDEPLHFRRIFLLTEGDQMVLHQGVMGAWVPVSLERIIAPEMRLPFHPRERFDPAQLAAAWQVPLEPATRTFIPLRQLTYYLPHPYLPQAIVAAAGRLLGVRPLALLYAVRLANLLAALALCRVALRTAPFLRGFLALLVLMPMAIFLRSTASPDGVIDALAVLLFAQIIALQGGSEESSQDGPPPPRVGRLAFFLATSAAVALCKGGYFLLPLAGWTIPPSRLGTRRRAASVYGALLLLACCGIAISASQAGRISSQQPPATGVDAAAQAASIVHRPFTFFALATRDYAVHAVRYAVSFVGNLGWLDTPLPAAVLLSGAFALLALAVGGATSRQATLVGWRWWWGAAIVATTMLLISAAQYLVFTPLGADRIDGLQGRYFIPLAPLGAWLFVWPRARHAIARHPWAVDATNGSGWPFALVAGGGVLATLLTVAWRYYGPLTW